jgi:adenosylhomocysteine nucleosidase
MIGIICPIETEAAPYTGAVSRMKKHEAAMQTVYEGMLNDTPVAIVCCGVCKVNAAIAAQALIIKHRVSAVMVSGTAGGIDTRLGVGDTVVATEAMYHDVIPQNLTKFIPNMREPIFKSDTVLLNTCREALERHKPKQPIYFGRIVTGEKFITQEGREGIINQFTPLCVDMETAAVAHVCYMHGVPFIAVRSVSDTGAQSGVGNFKKNVKMASEHSFEVVNLLLGALK